MTDGADPDPDRGAGPAGDGAGSDPGGDGVGPDRGAADPDRLVLYADYVCPFCRLGYATLRRYLADRDDRGLPALDVEWRPYDLRAAERGPDGRIPEGSGADREAYVHSRWSEVESLADRYGVEMRMDVDRYLRIDARNAQLVALGLTREAPDLAPEFHAAVYDALWTETRDVGDPEVLRGLLSGVGGDPDRVDQWLDDPELSERFARANAAAGDHDVRGVPTYVYGDRAVYGSRPPDAVRALVEDGSVDAD